jgi:hypothetical protein
MADPTHKMDKSAFSVVPLGEDTDAEDVAYWLSRPPEERFRALELLRQTVYGYSEPGPRLQRVLEIAELERS